MSPIGPDDLGAKVAGLRTRLVRGHERVDVSGGNASFTLRTTSTFPRDIARSVSRAVGRVADRKSAVRKTAEIATCEKNRRFYD